MNTRRASLFVLAIGGALASGAVACGGESQAQQIAEAERRDNMVKEMRREQALAAVQADRAVWAARKPTCPAYHYDRQMFLDPGPAITSVQIVADAPVWREYVVSSAPDAGSSLVAACVEQGPDVGSHPQGFRALTVEQLYDECEAVVSTSDLVGEFKLSIDEGVPTTCGFPDGTCIGPDCPKEIDLDGFSCGQIGPPQVAGDAGAGCDALPQSVDASSDVPPGASPDVP
jgi:hypothetical protein